MADSVDVSLTASGEQGSKLKQTVGQEGGRNKGMILPFQPLTMTFHDVNYFVDIPKVGAFIPVWVPLCFFSSLDV